MAVCFCRDPAGIRSANLEIRTESEYRIRKSAQRGRDSRMGVLALKREDCDCEVDCDWDCRFVLADSFGFRVSDLEFEEGTCEENADAPGLITPPFQSFIRPGTVES